jgi:hypothetical protein
MDREPSPLSIEILTSLRDIEPAAWDRLARGEKPSAGREMAEGAEPVAEGAAPLADERPGAPPSEANEPDKACEVAESSGEQDADNPFVSHAFLSALEESGSVGGRSGWTPLHLVARSDNGQLLGAVPAYAKSHSRGEYVFDHAFADAYHRAGGQYYPKLQVSVPFTPASAPKLLAAPEADATIIRPALVAGLEALRSRIDASSIHATFLTRADREAFLGAGYLERNDHQFHFANPGYRGFDDFLAALASRKRKVLKRERREALEYGISVEWVTGKALTEADWDAFFAFYIDTGSRKWGNPYLTRAFFSLIGERMADRILLVMAKRAGRYIAGALNFIGANTLYGRNWGAIEHHPFLHFELCYYQAIDFALAHGLARVEAGAQGEHKLARGYAPVRTVSAHRFADAGLHRAVADYLARERHAIRSAEIELEDMTPFRSGPITTGKA